MLETNAVFATRQNFDVFDRYLQADGGRHAAVIFCPRLADIVIVDWFRVRSEGRNRGMSAVLSAFCTCFRVKHRVGDMRTVSSCHSFDRLAS